MPYRNPNIESSYKENDLGRTLYTLVMTHRPKVIVEFGCLYGYSTVAMAMALQDLGEGRLVSYDLFEEYPFKHSTREQTQKNLEAYGCESVVELRQGDVYSWLDGNEHADMIHLDISNTGDAVDRIYEHVRPRMEKGMRFFIEGGSAERDNVEWMKKYNRQPLRSMHAPFAVIDERFPSISELYL